LPEGVERPPPPRASIWKPWTAWVALIAAFGASLMGALIVGVIGAAAGASFSDPTPAVSISATIVQDLSFIGAALLFAGMAGRPLPEQFGLRPTRFWPAVGWMAAAFAAFYAFTLVWVAILGVSPDDSKLPDELGVKDSTFALLAVAFLVAVVAPIAEEFFFRGFFFGALRNWKGPVAGGDHHRAGVRLDPHRLGRGGLPAAAGVLRLRSVPAARAHRIALSRRRSALHEQLARLRGLPALELADPRAARVRARAHLARRARGPREVDAGACPRPPVDTPGSTVELPA
jgi:membrane protease YdiL (CAAX protease family)